MVDKIEAKKYVSTIVGEKHIIPTLGVWEKFDDIDFNKLPNQFVLKCNHDSGTLIIVKDKSDFNIKKAKHKIERCLKRNYFYQGREWPYKNVTPRIFAEKYMEDNVNTYFPNEFQFWCFNGEPYFVSAIYQPHGENLKATYDMEWNRLPFVTSVPEYDGEVKKPQYFEQMRQCAIRLSKDNPFLRVDFMIFNSQYYFGELTKFPAMGLVKWKPQEYDRKLGELIMLPK